MANRRGFLSLFTNISGLFRNPQIRDVRLDDNGEFVDVQLNKRIGDPLRLDDKRTKNKLVIVNFFSTRTEEQQPVMKNLAEIARHLEKNIGREVFINSVTLDPEHDTPERLEKFAKQLNAPAGWTFVRVTDGAAKSLVERMSRVRGYTSGREMFYGTPGGYWGTFPADNSPQEVAHRLANSLPGVRHKKLRRAGPARRGEEKYPWTAREV